MTALLTTAALLAAVYTAAGSPRAYPCNVVARTEAGAVCGLARWADADTVYASFRGVPYARQPLGELRFKELQPVEPWGEKILNTTEEGPICYQTDVVYGSIMRRAEMSEACIHANIHVPLGSLHKTYTYTRSVGAPVQFPFGTDRLLQLDESRALPILVSIHGGGFQGGSGDADLHGPEYLVTKNIIVITFNYRLNVFGYLSLNSAEVPGNQALRDMVTLLRWVRRNARAFGGDPDNVTLLGQSAGAVAAHLLTLSKAAKGLYKRAFLMSGTATSGFYSASPLFSQQLTDMFLTFLGINSTDPEYIHKQLIQMPVEKFHMANEAILEQIGFSTFVPTVEAAHPGVTRILDDDPEVLVAEGRGSDVPLVIGFTSVECEVFRRRLDDIDIAQRTIANPILTVPSPIIFTTPPELLTDIAKRIDQRYYNGTPTTDGFIRYCTDGLYKYPALKLAEQRAIGGAPVYLYEFSYEGERSVLKEALNLSYTGAAHIEDLTYVFRTNSVLDGAQLSFPPVHTDDLMRDRMTMFLVNFMYCGTPVCEKVPAWPAVQVEELQFQDIRDPFQYCIRSQSEEQMEILQFFDSLRHK